MNHRVGTFFRPVGEMPLCRAWLSITNQEMDSVVERREGGAKRSDVVGTKGRLWICEALVRFLLLCSYRAWKTSSRMISMKKWW